MPENVIHLHIVDRNGSHHHIEAPTDMNLNVMEICKANNLPIEGTCGGMALCASCHVYILSNHELPSSSEDEENMLDQAFFVHENSRLCCQLFIDEDMNGLSLELAPISE